jgi:hypothetical protein
MYAGVIGARRKLGTVEYASLNNNSSPSDILNRGDGKRHQKPRNSCQARDAGQIENHDSLCECQVSLRDANHSYILEFENYRPTQRPADLRNLVRLVRFFLD